MMVHIPGTAANIPPANDGIKRALPSFISFKYKITLPGCPRRHLVTPGVTRASHMTRRKQDLYMGAPSLFFSTDCILNTLLLLISKGK